MPRPPRLAASLVIAALAATPAAVAQLPAPPACDVAGPWGDPARGTANLAMRLRNAGQPCTALFTRSLSPPSTYEQARVLAQPRHGSVSLGDGTVSYTPFPGYAGDDSFTLEGSWSEQGRRQSRAVTVIVTVLPPR
ncbi:MAG: Ig-like domain-containing protein [Acetobacteraceae bacterium]|jgi:hypothetical protein|nr:Ig-like domain-containing protein [Acetobacteraceae bacterium]